MEKDNRIGIVGCGNMGEAIARGIVDSKLIGNADIYAFDIDRDKVSYLSGELGIKSAGTSEELIDCCNNIIIAVKPQDIKDLLKEVWHVLDSSKLIISIVAGITIDNIKKHLNKEIRVIRVMPNMATLVNKGVAAICYDEYATDEDKRLANQIFKSVGSVIEIDESMMDAVTSISGSGPAYFFYITELLENIAKDMGIDRKKAKLLALGTAVGSAILLDKTGADAESLRRRVTSKGGTTEAAFKVFADRKLHTIFKDGVLAARERSRELSKGK
ncbi:MAG: pyrroline-5-carboxylate reductase [Candidatus Omnitrophica bacterium]|nr:pyrroline-5-carboxylate reductase [Candidatus Omnitrophota bacterium]